MLSNSQKEHLTYTAIGQIFTLVVLGVFTYQYILPGLWEISEVKGKAQISIDSYNSVLKEGIDYAGLAKILESRPENAELVKIIQSDSKTTQEIIKKPGTSQKDYIDWIKWEIILSAKDKDNLKLEKSKLNSIIPTMSPLSSSIEEENITLRKYVKFIENNILKRFNFDSNIIIGMQWITFGVKWGAIPENLGVFDFRIDFKATNSDIIKFIDYVNNAGKPDILSLSGTTTINPQSLAVLSNPLITMENFAIQDKLDKDNLDKINNGRATLRFYVRWVSKEDITYLKENLKARQVKLKTSIDDNIKICEKDTILCASYNKKLTIFNQKYLEYIRSSDISRSTLWGSDEIYGLTQSVETLKSLEKEFETILPKTKK